MHRHNNSDITAVALNLMVNDIERNKRLGLCV